MRKTVIALLIGMFIIFSLIQGIPKYSADTQSGFILASAGKDGQWGTSDDVFATEKENAVQGAVNTTQYNLTSLVPSNLQIGKIVLLADKTSVPADGKTTITIQAIGYDKYGNLLPDGTVINFSTTLGTLSSTSAKITNGAATVSISSPNEGTATVTANNGNIFSSISLVFLQPFSFNITSSNKNAFDGDLTTYVSIPPYSPLLMITWNGDLSNKKLAITLAGYYYPGGDLWPIYVYIYDAIGNQIQFVNADTNTTVNYVKVYGFKNTRLGYVYSPETIHVIVPPNAAKIGIGAYYYGGRVYEISVVN